MPIPDQHLSTTKGLAEDLALALQVAHWPFFHPLAYRIVTANIIIANILGSSPPQMAMAFAAPTTVQIAIQTDHTLPAPLQ
jgi:hypothetical protein